MSVRTLTHCITLVHSLRIGGKLLGQDLQRHIPVQLGIGGTVDLSHTTFANFLQNLGMANGRSDHESPPHAMQLGAMLRREAAKDNGNRQDCEDSPLQAWLVVS